MGAIEIAEPDPAWPSIFESEAQRVARAIGDLARRIEHVGSTSVPGLAAKPVIDIQISVDTITPLRAWCDRLARLDYVHVPHEDDRSYPFFHKPATWPHDFHIHLCELASPEERWNLAFRDYLRAHPETRDAYAAEKRRLAAQHDDGSFDARNAYAAAKGAFIDGVVRRALNEGYGR